MLFLSLFFLFFLFLVRVAGYTVVGLVAAYRNADITAIAEQRDCSSATVGLAVGVLDLTFRLSVQLTLELAQSK